MWWFLLSTTILGTSVLFSYAVVLFDAFSLFPVANASSGYLRSPYWIDLPASSTFALLIFQIFAAVGYVGWFVALLLDPPSRGLLAQTWALACANMLFLVPSIAWSFAAHRYLRSAALGDALLASACLWLASTGMCLLLGGTFEDQRASPLPLVGILLTATVVVLADGVGWSAMAIYRAIE